MTYKTPADIASSEYCSEHSIFYERYCPDCTLEQWATFYEKPDSEDFVRLKDI